MGNWGGGGGEGVVGTNLAKDGFHGCCQGGVVQAQLVHHFPTHVIIHQLHQNETGTSMKQPKTDR